MILSERQEYARSCYGIRPNRQRLLAESVEMDMAERQILWRMTGFHLCRVPDADNAFDNMSIRKAQKFLDVAFRRGCVIMRT